MDVKALQWELAAFVAERGLESRHSPKSLAMALVGEGGTLLDLFKWLSDEESRQVGRQEREAAAAAIAEIFLHALRLADELGIDVEDAVAKKGAKLGGKPAPEGRPDAPRTPPPAAPSVERPAKPAAPPVQPASRSAAPPPEFPRVREAPAAPAPDFSRVRQAPAAPQPDFPRVRPAAPPAPPAASRPVPINGPPSVRSASRSAAPPAASRPVPINGPPSVRSASRSAAPPPAPRPAPAARSAPPPSPSEPPPEVEPYADLDLDAVGELVKSLAKRIDAAQSEDPLVRELHDELGTLRRTLYSKTFKRSWIGASLKSVRTMLGAALNEDIGEEIKARQHVAEIDRLLGE